MEYGRNLHKTCRTSHSITKSSSASSSSSSSSSSSDGSSLGSPKPVPVIRVVHIFNPTVIKTDAAHFRSLVQELTGTTSFARGKASRQRCVEPPVAPAGEGFPVDVHLPKRNQMYIPERLGNLSDMDIISSFQEPAAAAAGVMDLSSILPSLGKMNEESMTRFSSLYEPSF